MFRDVLEDDAIVEQHNSILFGCGAEARKTASVDDERAPSYV
jgi:hypothetical protein